jgi:hypothetical protein
MSQAPSIDADFGDVVAAPVPLRAVTLSRSTRGFHVAGTDRTTGRVVATWDGKDPAAALHWLSTFAARVANKP